MIGLPYCVAFDATSGKVGMKFHFLSLAVPPFLCILSFAGETKILTNHLGYEPGGPKHAVILGKANGSFSNCSLRNYGDDRQVLALSAKESGPVQKWRDWNFWTLDFDSFSTEGKYYLECDAGAESVRSFPFLIQ